MTLVLGQYMLQARPHAAPLGLRGRADAVHTARQEVCGEAEERASKQFQDLEV